MLTSVLPLNSLIVTRRVPFALSCAHHELENPSSTGTERGKKKETYSNKFVLVVVDLDLGDQSSSLVIGAAFRFLVRARGGIFRVGRGALLCGGFCEAASTTSGATSAHGLLHGFRKSVGEEDDKGRLVATVLCQLWSAKAELS